jgi:FPC/CPF motif-containing protein YcgG
LSTSKNIKDRFKKLISSTYCPFAKDAVIMYASDWDTDIEVKENLEKILPQFLLFVTEGIQNGYELFIVEVRQESIISRIQNFAGFLNKLLHEIHLLDTKAVRYFTEGIETMEWDFTFNKVRFFVPTFAPFYEKNHPRYSFNSDTAFIMFQPDSTFDKYNISSKNSNRNEITERVKNLFLENNINYNLRYVRGSIKAIRYLKPVNLQGSPIKWWLNDQYL